MDATLQPVPASASFATLCYLPPAHYVGLERFVENMLKYPAAGRVIFYTDTEGPTKERLAARTVPPIPEDRSRGIPLSPGFTLPPSSSWLPSSFAFLDACRIALTEQLDFFFYLETDCRVTQPGWDRILWEEHCRCPQAVTSGTPAVWNPWSTRGDWRRELVEYVNRYNAASGCLMPLCGPSHSPLNIYPNGALAFYKTSEVHEAFRKTLDGLEREKAAAIRCTPFDYKFGEHLMGKYGLRVFDRIGILPSSYSGCGNVLMSEARRVAMVQDKTKVAVHQIKSNDL